MPLFTLQAPHNGGKSQVTRDVPALVASWYLDIGKPTKDRRKCVSRSSTRFRYFPRVYLLDWRLLFYQICFIPLFSSISVSVLFYPVKVVFLFQIRLIIDEKNYVIRGWSFRNVRYFYYLIFQYFILFWNFRDKSC